MRSFRRIDFRSGHLAGVSIIDVSCACGWDMKDIPFKGEDSYAARRKAAHATAKKLHKHCPLDDVAKTSSISLKKIERIAKRASPGPWYAEPCNTKDCWCRCITLGPHDDSGIVPSGCMNVADATFVCAANPAVVLRLINRIRKLEKVLDEATAVMLSAADVISQLGEDEEEVDEERDRARTLIKVLKERP